MFYLIKNIVVHVTKSVKVSIAIIAFVITAMAQRTFRVRLSVWKGLKNTITNTIFGKLVLAIIDLDASRINLCVGLRSIKGMI